MTDWHRHFGLILTDLFTGTCFEVELEKDLSQKKQLLDVVILRRSEGTIDRKLPDGFDDLADHNLLTFKSHRETLDDWSLKELTGHYVNYRKQVSPGFDRLLPEEGFRLFAICARRPDKLAGQLTLTERQQGVYDLVRGTDIIRLVVSSEVEEAEHNAPLLLFSAIPDIVRFGAEHFAKHDASTSNLVNRLFIYYGLEGIEMPYTLEDYRRDTFKEFLDHSTEEQREEFAKKLPAEKLRQLLPPEERLKGVSVEDLLRLLPDEVIREIQNRSENGNGQKSNGDDGTD